MRIDDPDFELTMDMLVDKSVTPKTDKLRDRIPDPRAVQELLVLCGDMEAAKEKAMTALKGVRNELHRMPDVCETHAEARVAGCRDAIYDIVEPIIAELEEVK